MQLHRKIISQGERDGACFLYSMANSVMALTGKILKQDVWNDLIGALGDATDFLRSDTGTLKIDADDQELTRFASLVLKHVSPRRLKLEVDCGPRPTEVSNALSDSTVLVVTNNWHWFCIVDSDEQYCYAACSAKLHENPLTYREELSPKYCRIYNDAFPLKELKVSKYRCLRISEA